jgi:hypothetical protein
LLAPLKAQSVFVERSQMIPSGFVPAGIVIDVAKLFGSKNHNIVGAPIREVTHFTVGQDDDAMASGNALHCSNRLIGVCIDNFYPRLVRDVLAMRCRIGSHVVPAFYSADWPALFNSQGLLRLSGGRQKKTAQCGGGKKNITGDSLSHIWHEERPGSRWNI